MWYVVGTPEPGAGAWPMCSSPHLLSAASGALSLTPSPLPLQGQPDRQVIFLHVPRCGFLLVGGVLHRRAERFNIVGEQLVSILNARYNKACFKPP